MVVWGGSFALDWVAGLPWTEWQLSRGLGGRLQWNTQSASCVVALTHDELQAIRLKANKLSKLEDVRLCGENRNHAVANIGEQVGSVSTMTHEIDSGVTRLLIGSVFIHFRWPTIHALAEALEDILGERGGNDRVVPFNKFKFRNQ